MSERTPQAGPGPTGGAGKDDDNTLGDLDLREAAGVDVTGGSTSYVARAPGESRPGIEGTFRGGGSGGGVGPTAKKASGAIIDKLVAEQASGGSKTASKGRIVRDTRWLVKDKKSGELKRAESGVEGEALTLEATLEPSLAPDGMPCTFEVFQQERSGADESARIIEGTVQGGKALVDWTCSTRAHTSGKPLEPTVYFKAAVADDSARSTILSVDSWLDMACLDKEGKPLAECEYVVVLPGNREKRGKTDKDGTARFSCPPGLAQVNLVKPAAKT